ncbi:FecR family protein [Aquimarina sp. 2201CG5-10]|uniref:FecR family protein n=1 Tax=Aquimarina callyspongiae TaxID=3098150 RepID=UPI002AB5521E|nr:FecR domain-containing protein [Aquimarina sp. 2201CG5-10]MDY8137198.1 FecR domain-containing protein [Aquimarina sp. 2201CG5-10]
MLEKDNTYLAKWLNDELSAEELSELKGLPEYEDYKKIREGLTYFDAPTFDAQKSLETTIGKLNTQKKGRVINFKPFIYAISAAACILLIMGLFFNTVTYSADPGKQLVATLPDGSSVELNAASTLSHQRFFWSKERTVDLDGEAFFKVAPGKTFTVKTNLGDVKVLGTEFNVKARSEEFNVACYHGKVLVSTDAAKTTLQKGEAAILEGKKLIEKNITGSEPLWMNGESLFDRVALGNVLDEIERQYDVNFIRNSIDQNRLFTGGFIHTDLKIALESVLEPMGIRYVVTNTTITLSSP